MCVATYNDMCLATYIYHMCLASYTYHMCLVRHLFLEDTQLLFVQDSILHMGLLVRASCVTAAVHCTFDFLKRTRGRHVKSTPLSLVLRESPEESCALSSAGTSRCFDSACTCRCF